MLSLKEKKKDDLSGGLGEIWYKVLPLLVLNLSNGQDNDVAES